VDFYLTHHTFEVVLAFQLAFQFFLILPHLILDHFDSHDVFLILDDVAQLTSLLHHHSLDLFLDFDLWVVLKYQSSPFG